VLHSSIHSVPLLLSPGPPSVSSLAVLPHPLSPSPPRPPQPMGVISSNKKADDPNATFTNCSLSTPGVCEETGGRLKVFPPPPIICRSPFLAQIGGPFWSGPIHKLVSHLLPPLV
jgi:hypothetical protein